MKFYVYALRVKNEYYPFYIGKSFIGSRRFHEHKMRAQRGDTQLVYNKIRKLIENGIDFVEDVIIVTDKESFSFEMESFLISFYGRRNNKSGILCNLTDGGEGCSGHMHSNKSKALMSKAKLGNKINAGRKRPDMTDRFSKVISQYDKNGNWIATFSSAREASSKTGIHFCSISDCANGKIRITKLENMVYTWRHGDSKSSTIIPAAKRGKQVDQYDLNKNYIKTFSNASQAARTLSINQVSISSACRGIQKTAGGYIWKFKN